MAQGYASNEHLPADVRKEAAARSTGRLSDGFQCGASSRQERTRCFTSRLGCSATGVASADEY